MQLPDVYPFILYYNLYLSVTLQSHFFRHLNQEQSPGTPAVRANVRAGFPHTRHTAANMPGRVTVAVRFIAALALPRRVAGPNPGEAQ